MHAVELDSGGDGIHRVLFRNGSRLSGIVMPDVLNLQLSLGPKIQIPRQKIRRIVWPGELDPPAAAATVLLAGGDRLIGSMTDAQLTVETEFGPMQVSPDNISAVTFDKAPLGRAELKLWGGSTVRGKLAGEKLGFVLEPDGPKIDLDVSRIRTIRLGSPLPPESLQLRIEKLIGQLGDAEYKSRQAAAAELARIGKAAAPFLRKRLDDPDTEVRRRVRDILEKVDPSEQDDGSQPDDVGQGLTV